MVYFGKCCDDKIDDGAAHGDRTVRVTGLVNLLFGDFGSFHTFVNLFDHLGGIV